MKRTCFRLFAFACLCLAIPLRAQVFDDDEPDCDEDDPCVVVVDPGPTEPTFPTNSGNPTALTPIDQSNRAQNSVGDPVDVASGAENFSLTLLSLHGLRDLDFTVHYNSLQIVHEGDLGFGWSHSYAATAKEAFDGSAVTIKWSQNSAHVYTLVLGSSPKKYLSSDDAAFYDTVTKNGDGTFTLVTRNRSTYHFDNAGRLVEDRNRHGQVIQINYANATSSQLASMVEPVSGVSLAFTYDAHNHITRIADNAGRAVLLSYDDVNAVLTQRTDPNGNKVNYTYSNQQLVGTIAGDGTLIHFNVYDKKAGYGGRIVKQDDGISTNRLLRVSYDEKTQKGNIIAKVNDRIGGITTYIHDSNYRLISKTDQLNRTTTTSYDAHGNVIQVVDALGRTQNFTYDPNGNLATLTDAAGGKTSFVYDANGNVLSITNALGKVATFKYDANSNPLESVDFAGNRTSRTFDANSQLISVQSPRGGITTSTYVNGRVATTTDALNNTSRFTYDAAGRLIAATDPTGATITYTYSGTDKILSKTDPLGNRTSYSYDARDRLVSVTDPLNGTLRYTYDANSNVASITNALGQTTKNSYDGEDRLVKLTDALGHVTSYSYDAVGELISTTDALGNTARFEYDAVGNRTGAFDPLGNRIMQTVFDARNSPTKVTDALGRTASQSYDALSRLVQRVDALGQNSSFTYDGLGRMLTASDPANLTSRQSYDENGNRAGLIDPGGNGLTFSYDVADRLVSTATTGGRVTRYDHDERGLVSGITYPSGTTAGINHDANGRMTRWSDATGTIDYAYDAKGQVTSITEGGKAIKRVYDALDRVTSFTDSNGNTIQYTYDAVGNLVTLTYPDGKKVNYSYDAANRLVGVTDWANRSTQYTYDANGRLIKTIRPNGTQQTKDYDPAGQLISLVDKATDSSIIVQYICNYDANGRLASEKRTPAIQSLSFSSNFFTYSSDNRLTGASNQSIAHDANGNMISAPLEGAMAGFSYDARNRLTSAGSLTYTYDAENRRIGSSGTTYVIDPNAGLSRLLLTVSPSGSTTRYVYGLGVLYQETDGSTVRYLHEDTRGNTIALSGATGTTIGRVEYGPFGEIASRTGDTATVFLYCGKFGIQTDSNALLNMRARCYHPQLGRFVQQDTVIGTISLSTALNRYAYASNNPFRFNDPLGLCSDETNTPGFWDGFKQGFKNSFSGGNLALTVGLTLATIAAPEIMIPAMAAVGGFGAGYGLAEWADNGFAYNPNVAGNIAGNIAGSTLISGGISVGAGLLGSSTAAAETASTRWGPATGPGPLSDDVANTFRSGSYTESVLGGETPLYRSYGGTAGELGSYWTRTPPAGSLQATMDSALNPAWGNTAQNVSTIKVPAGTTIYEGAAAPQGGLLGGGNQVYIPKVNPNWLIRP